MAETISQFRVNEARRKVLIVEDNELNREILASILEDEYDVLTAENGQEGLDLLAEHHKELSLVVLDVYMPICNGFEFLQRIAPDKVLSAVPVIVATGSDKPEDETRCLQLGAVDFVTKPYNPRVVLSRIRSHIRFRESVAALSVVERDDLTGLYTMQAFYHHVGQAIARGTAGSYTMLMADIHNFRLITAVFGRQKADEVLRFVADKVKGNGATDLCAREDDHFYLFLPGIRHIDPALFDSQFPITLDDAPVPNLQLEIGIYENVDTDQAPSVLCNRALIASERAASILGRKIGYYDDALHQKLVEDHTIESTIPTAIAEHQLQAFYQPKVNVETGKVVGAEALVRWVRPDGSMLPPGKFIPLVEQNGQIAMVDEYMFREVCAFQKSRLGSGKRAVPISINLSRNSLYQKDVLEKYLRIAREVGIPLDLIPIELTESASTGGKMITELVRQFSDAGFSLHMDDFGTGYSSLGCFTAMPFSVIKLDKSLTDQIGTMKGETLIEHMILIAHKIGEEIVAEGVEHQEQVDFLRSIHCDYIQGFFFYSPKRRADFEAILDK